MPVVSAVTRAALAARIWAVVVTPGSVGPPAYVPRAYIPSAECAALLAVRAISALHANFHDQVSRDQVPRVRVSLVPTPRSERSTAAVRSRAIEIDFAIATAFVIETDSRIAASAITAWVGDAGLGLLGGDTILGSGTTILRTIRATSRTWLMPRR